jgi:predicted GIY-YIG superfamily endonuclease
MTFTDRKAEWRLIVNGAISDKASLYQATFEAKGTRYYKACSAYAKGTLKTSVPLKLRHQPNNEHDHNAVGIYLKSTGEMLAHIPRENARRIRYLIEADRIVSAKAARVRKAGEHVLFDCQVAIINAVQESDAWKRALTMTMQPGVYSIKYSLDGSTYIGESCNIRNRLLQHLKELDAGCHHNPVLQDIFNDNGADVFDFAMVEIVEDTSKRLARETEIIEQIRSAGISVLLNCTPDGKKDKNPFKIRTGNSNYRGYIDAETMKWIEEMEFKSMQENIDAGSAVIKSNHQKSFFQKMLSFFRI